MNTRYEDILYHANNLIQSKGFKGFSYADLSKKIGVTKASIHHHFPSKEDLGIAYCEKKIQELEHLKGRINSQDDPVLKLELYFNAFELCSKNIQMCGIHAMQSDSDDMSDKLVNKIIEVSEFELQILTDILSGSSFTAFKQFGFSPYEQAIILSSVVKNSLLRDKMMKSNFFEKFCNRCLDMIE